MARGSTGQPHNAAEGAKAPVALFAVAAVLALAVGGLAWWLGGAHPEKSLFGGVSVAIAPLHTDLMAPMPREAPPAAPAPKPPIPAPATVPKKPADTANSLVLKPAAFQPTAPGGQHALIPAPDPGLIEHGRYGFLPVVGPDHRQPWQVYARPFDLGDPRPRIAIIVTGLGIGSTATDSAINRLPPDVTLAFAPFSRRVAEWTSLARLAGHEVLLELPMEPVDYPRQDPGYNALLTAYAPAQNLDRLDWVMSQTVGYVGFIGRMGGRFEAAHDSLAPVLQAIAGRGLLFVDNRASTAGAVSMIAAGAKLPLAAANRVIDTQPDGPRSTAIWPIWRISPGATMWHSASPRPRRWRSTRSRHGPPASPRAASCWRRFRPSPPCRRHRRGTTPLGAAGRGTMSAGPPLSSEAPLPGYRANVGIMLLAADGRVFVGRRRDAPDAWQMPQGGIDPGETPAEAVMRELGEEVGTSAADILFGLDAWLNYALPQAIADAAWRGRWRGQSQKWFVLRFTGTEDDIRIDTDHPEFDAWRWVPRADLPGLIVAFKRPVYEALLTQVEPRLKQLGY